MAEVTQTPVQSSSQTRDDLMAGAVGERVARLREQAASDPEGAREQAWSWIRELGRRAPSDRAGTLAELQQLFLCGKPARGVSGQTEGLLVTWTMNPVLDKVLGSVTNAWMPWLGKKFFPEESRGVNTLTRSARLPSKLLWPVYTMGDTALGHSAFDFTTYVEAGKLDPTVEVLVIDYASVSANPKLLIRQIRDELVEILHVAKLLKMLVDLPRRRELFPALYFALKSELQ